jgi:hypothetical protein
VGNFSEGAGLQGGTKHGAVFAIFALRSLGEGGPVASFLSFTSVAVQVLLKAGHLSPYTSFIESSGAITVMSPYTVFS